MKLFMLSSLFRIKLCKNITSNFFLSLDCCADTTLRHFYLVLTSMLLILAVLNFALNSSIFLFASVTYFSHFSLFLPLFLTYTFSSFRDSFGDGSAYSLLEPLPLSFLSILVGKRSLISSCGCCPSSKSYLLKV